MADILTQAAAIFNNFSAVLAASIGISLGVGLLFSAKALFRKR